MTEKMPEITVASDSLTTDIMVHYSVLGAHVERCMTLQENLRKLYLLDQQVRGIRTRLDHANDRLHAQKVKLTQFNQQQAEMGDQLKHTQAKASALENQSEGIEQRIAHLRQQMQIVKSNKEYSAILIEVNTLKLDKGKLEDEALEQLNQAERLSGELQDIQSRVAEQEKLVEAAASDVQTCKADIGQQLDDLTSRRAEAEQDIPESIRSVFNRMADMHEGEAMATVTEESRRHMEYACGGCYMSIPVERVNALMTQQDQLVLCPSCNRILYLDQDLKASISCK